MLKEHKELLTFQAPPSGVMEGDMWIPKHSTGTDTEKLLLLKSIDASLATTRLKAQRLSHCPKPVITSDVSESKPLSMRLKLYPKAAEETITQEFVPSS